ncbi:MAG: ATP synthase F0 subunit B [Thermodesulfobacteriota bacterium]
MKIFPDWTVAPQILNFLIIIFVMNFLVYRPIRGAIRNRKETFGGMTTEISQAEKGAAAKLAALEEGIAKARAEGAKQKDAITAAAMAEEKRIITEINERAAAELAEMRGKIGADVGVARGALEAEIGAFAQAISEKILGRALN